MLSFHPFKQADLFMSIEKNLLNCITIEPSQKPLATMIWLHGLGAEGNDFTPILPALHPQITQYVRFIFPDAPVMPVTINNGYPMRAWFDISHPNLEAKTDQEGIERSVAQLNNLIDFEVEKGILRENIFLGGFSQGAVIALSTALKTQQPLAGAIALSGYLPDAADLINHAKLTDLPIFIAHGTQDYVVPFPLGLQIKTLLTEANFQVTWQQYPIAHHVCPEEIADIDQWIRDQLEKINK